MRHIVGVWRFWVFFHVSCSFVACGFGRLLRMWGLNGSYESRGLNSRAHGAPHGPMCL